MKHCTKESIRFCSADGETQVAGYFYTPISAKIKGVIQISHGMCEYVGRYESMIDVLTAQGYAVCGNDHLGHGDTSPDCYGFFAEKNGYQLLLEDLDTMNRLARSKYPGCKLILFGHSMGSFFARWYAEKNPEAMDALVLSGTGGPGFLMQFGKGLACVLSAIRGPRYISKFMVKASTGSYSRGIEDSGSPSVWLSRDPAVWAAYDQDPKCTFSFTVSAYRDLLTAHTHVNTRDWAQRMRKDLPVYLYSGDKDPVGNYGKGVRAVYDLLMEAGVEDVTLRLYPGGRHEMHNETNREEVFQDLISWCDTRLS